MGKHNGSKAKRGSDAITPPTVEIKRPAFTPQATVSHVSTGVQNPLTQPTQHGYQQINVPLNSVYPFPQSAIFPQTPVQQQSFLPTYFPPSPVFEQSATTPGNTATSTLDHVASSLQTIVKRLDGIDSKMAQLSSIQASIIQINQRLDSMDSRINDIEQSTAFGSSKFDLIE